jgi:hypothetical protein
MIKFTGMQSIELRLGNYIYQTKGGISMPSGPAIKVLSIGIFEIEHCFFNEIPAQIEIWTKTETRYLTPIQLTEEWLLKFGFEKHGDCDAYPKGYYSHGNLQVNLDDQFSPAISDPEGNAHYIGNSCEYVHQLQNLYFALTGEELLLTH